MQLLRALDPPCKCESKLKHSRYIPVHLEYILTEILKNSFRATIENHCKRHGMSSTKSVSPVIITISTAGVPDHSGRTFLSIRIRDQGGGVSPVNMSRIFSYAFTTAGHKTDNGSCGGPYAAQQVGGSAAVDAGSSVEGNLFGEITSKGLQTSMGTIAGLGYGLPMSRLYAAYVYRRSIARIFLFCVTGISAGP
jgi:26S proteasome regulatory subunit T1